MSHDNRSIDYDQCDSWWPEIAYTLAIIPRSVIGSDSIYASNIIPNAVLPRCDARVTFYRDVHLLVCIILYNVFGIILVVCNFVKFLLYTLNQWFSTFLGPRPKFIPENLTRPTWLVYKIKNYFKNNILLLLLL